jgi:hypothetical protein
LKAPNSRPTTAEPGPQFKPLTLEIPQKPVGGSVGTRLEPPTGWSSCLVRIKTKLLELPSPVRVWITQALDVDAAGQAALDRRLDELRRKKRERER